MIEGVEESGSGPVETSEARRVRQGTAAGFCLETAVVTVVQVEGIRLVYAHKM